MRYESQHSSENNKKDAYMNQLCKSIMSRNSEIDEAEFENIEHYEENEVSITHESPSFSNVIFD